MKVNVSFLLEVRNIGGKKLTFAEHIKGIIKQEYIEGETGKIWKRCGKSYKKLTIKADKETCNAILIHKMQTS